MQIRGVVLVTIALFLGIAALVLHLLALCSPHWKITKRDAEPVLSPVSYGLWQRCENTNLTIMKQGVALGVRPNVEICRPNLYMRYTPQKFSLCYNIRRNCPVLQVDQIPEGCSCRYLPSTRALQWLTVSAAIFLIIGILLLYLNNIAQPQNESAVLLVRYAPFICFLSALLLLATGLILFGAFLRRDTYEDFSFPLQSLKNDMQSYDLHSLRNYAKSHEENVSRELYTKAEQELREDANTHYHTIIGRATVYEIIATTLIFIVTAVTFWFATSSRAEDL
ncbi:unnamed protein product [Adineta steineri]|uniref:Uncharacterized protein n=1 Tax=Adineta steineri TaxID=433720 RepID=A0A814T2K1_9BILA|nr:unnamed protein product [Adineta steineri]CAF1420942.1 unnamed protein product [Adineta steineri]CAF3697464.1 unnamed protein product [Adineta steineri]CAF4036048.1 unnamed protein product [Adineta steineri]